MRTIEQFKVGERVSWLQQTGYGLNHNFEGEVVKITPKRLTIKLDDWYKPVSVYPQNVRHA